MARFSPEVWTLGLKIGAIYVQRSINNFDDWSAKMTESCGTKIEPWLSAIWETLCNIPEGSKFNDKQISALADRIGGLYGAGTTNLYEIAKAIEVDLGAENTAKLFPMIQAHYMGIKRYFDDLEGKTSNAIKSKLIASGTCGENLTWTLDDDGTLTISGTGEMKNYVYDSDNDSINSPWWDYREAIKRIIIYDGVTSIGNWAFDGCKSLKNLEMPSSIMTIGKAAFDGCDSLNSLKIPGNVTTIRRGSFSLCMNLKSIKIPDSVTTIGSFAFSLCMNLKDVKISSNVTTIGEETFSWCSSLTSIEIPTSVMTIGKNVFNECINLEKIYYPSGRGFEENLSQGNNAKLIPYDVASSAIEAGTRGICGKNLIWTLDDDGTLTISGTGEMKSYPQVQNLPWFNYRKRIKNVVIDFGVTSISERIFWNCKSLSKITISDSVTSIGERAFWNVAYISKKSIILWGAALKKFCQRATRQNLFHINSVKKWQSG